MYIFEGDNVNEIFIKSVGRLIKNGEITNPRGLKTVELSPVVIRLYNPKNKFLFHPWRKLNPFSIISELVWILGGNGDVVFPALFNKQLLKWVDNFDLLVKNKAITVDTNGVVTKFNRKMLEKIEFNAPYGVRIRRAGHGRNVDQLTHVIEELKKDKDSRRAVISLWNHDFDRLDKVTADRPCNFSLIFKIVDSKLNLTVINRSNDILLGLFNVNIPIFTSIQEIVAIMLNVKVGEYYHFTNSFHMYLDHPMTKQMKLNFEEDRFGYVESLSKAERFIPFHYYKEEGRFFERGMLKSKEASILVTQNTFISKISYLTDCQNIWYDIMKNKNINNLKMNSSMFRNYTLKFLKTYMDIQKSEVNSEKKAHILSLFTNKNHFYNTDWEILAFMMYWKKLCNEADFATGAVELKSLGALWYDIALTMREHNG